MKNNTSLASNMFFGCLTSALDSNGIPVGSATVPILQFLLNRRAPADHPQNLSSFIKALNKNIEENTGGEGSEFYTIRYDVSETSQALAIELLRYLKFDTSAYLLDHSEDPNKAADALLTEKSDLLPHPCEELLLTRIKFLLTAWFSAMADEPIVVSDIASSFRQEVLKELSSQSKNLEDIKEAVSEIPDNTENFDNLSEQNVDHSKMMLEMKATLDSVREHQLSSISTDSDDYENTAIHGQISAINNLVIQDELKTALTSINKLHEEKWEEATHSEKNRIYAVKANAYINLGDIDAAISNLSDAIEIFPQHKRSKENRALLHLLKEEFVEAESVALEVLDDDPSSLNAACIVVQCRKYSESEDLLRSLPSGLRDHPRIQGTSIWIMSAQEDTGWEQKAIEAYNSCTLDKDERYPLTQMYALAIIEIASKTDLSASLGGRLENITVNDLVEASNIYVNLAEIALKNQSSNVPERVNNAANALRLIGDDVSAQKAATLLDSALTLFPEQQMLIHHRSILALISSDFRWIVENVPDDTLDPDLYAQRVQALIKCSRLEEAAACVSRIDYDDDVMRHCFVLDLRYQIYTDTGLLDRKNISELLIELEKICLSNPTEIKYQNVFCQILRREGDLGRAESILRSSLPYYQQSTPLGDRMLAAIEADAIDHPDIIVLLLRGHVRKDIDSQPLSMLVLALLNNHDYLWCKELLDDLDVRIRELPYYKKSLARLTMRVGDSEALLRVSESLVDDPNNSELLCYKIHQIQSLNDGDEADSIIRDLNLGTLSGPISYQLKLCTAAIHKSRAIEGWEALHNLLLGNWDNHKIHLAYQTIPYVNGDIANLFITPVKVQNNTVFTLRDSNDAEFTYCIIDDPPNFLSADAIDSNSELAIIVINKCVGEVVSLGQGYARSESAIVRVETLYQHILKKSASDFPARFPTVQGNFTVSIKSDADGLSDEFTNIVKEQAEGTTRALELYRSGEFPVELLAEALSCDVLEARFALFEKNIPCLNYFGLASERKEAREAILNNQVKGCVLDVLTAHYIYSLGMWDIVKKICGEIHLTTNSIQTFSTRVKEVENYDDGPQLSVRYEEGAVGRSEISVEQLQNIYDYRLKEREFIRSSGVQISSLPTADMSARLKLYDQFNAHVLFDPVVAADREGLLLVTEDRAYRLIAKSVSLIESVWLQPILDVALEQSLISDNEYVEVIIKMVESKVKYTAINANCLLLKARADGFKITDGFRLLLEEIADDEIADDYANSVIGNYFKLLSKEPISRTMKFRYMSEVLNVFVKAGSDDAKVAISALLRRVDAAPQYWGHANNWYQWHYMDFR